LKQVLICFTVQPVGQPKTLVVMLVKLLPFSLLELFIKVLELEV
jgi:hypothetical protein